MKLDKVLCRLFLFSCFGLDRAQNTVGSLSKGVFERRTATGSGRFSFLGSGWALIFK